MFYNESKLGCVLWPDLDCLLGMAGLLVISKPPLQNLLATALTGHRVCVLYILDPRFFAL